ncbi:hypothetical protein FRB95_007102 [Tulasnella sp. JGI-2019a]|nr:hypothetical protein FRB93_004529 [Tulasnella sp. JGI-2019a]KAG9027868.1 hypothetical protein FRB95_007102 [Tulasnella sp. JGI-2019a]
MGYLNLVALASLALASAVNAAVTWTAIPFNPASIPLAVRTPYLSTWLPQGAGTALNAAWPTFWNGDIQGWAGYIRVDGTVYNFLGVPSNTGSVKAVQKSMAFTSTQSTFVLTAGGVDLTVNFLSPVEPTNLVLQSLPFSYMALTVKANDGGSHSVQVYSDISAEWASGDSSQTVNWGLDGLGTTVVTHYVQLSTQQQYTEYNDHIQQGAAYYSTSNSVSMTYQSGQDTVVRGNFISTGKLPSTQDGNFRAVSNAWPVFAFAHDLGTVTATASAPVVYTVGRVRDPAIEYIIAGGALQARSNYFWSAYTTVDAAIAAFLPDYANALTRANTFDAKVQADASAISADYASIVALSIRQALGATEITISKTSTGAWNTADIMMFLKEISSDGNVSTVDVIFPAWPVFLYVNPTFGKYLLTPLFAYQATGQYPNKWAVHDMGASYPKALGHNDGADEPMPLEESGNMLIMTLSYAQKTGDNSLLTTYSALLDQWTQFLVAEALIPASQISTDDFAGSLANQTNLAIKGIIGIQAMSNIWTTLGNPTKSANYSSIASSYVTKWQTLATATGGTHLTLAYGNSASWGLSYNLYADKLLKLNLFPASVYTMQTAWYKTVEGAYGIPLDTRHTYTKSDWEIWTSAIVTDTTLRNFLVTSVKNFAADGLNSSPFGDWYETTTGASEGFRARPVVGGHLALLVL